MSTISRNVHTSGQPRVNCSAGVCRPSVSHAIGSLMHEIETAWRVHSELCNVAADAYDAAALSLAHFSLNGIAPSAAETKELYAMFEAFDTKWDAAAEVHSRKSDAIRRLILELRHPMPAA